MKTNRRLAAISLVCLFFVLAGCGTYGKLRLQAASEGTMTIRQLEKNWEQYNILETGAPKVPSAIVFDRKEDDRVILGERWWSIKDRKSLSGSIGKIEAQGTVGPYYPRLWRMLGPDDHLYGYMFTAWDNTSVVVEIVDGKTMKVQDLPMPPSFKVGGEGD